MKTLFALFGLASLLSAAPAFAASDLSVVVAPPSGLYVDDLGTWDVVVSNVGNKSASNVSLSIELPETSTSPSVYVLGDLGSFDSRCTLSGTELTCSLGTLRKNRSRVVSFDIALPYSAAPVVVSADASTTSSENSYGNNSDSDADSPSYYSNAITGPLAVTNWHCTGQSLTSFYECELFPSSITSHPHTFEANGTISFPFATTVTGAWQQGSSDELTFQYYDGATLIADFVGVGVDGGCWEGVTDFGNGWVSPYQICP